jgi:hypothetical protein
LCFSSSVKALSSGDSETGLLLATEQVNSHYIEVQPGGSFVLNLSGDITLWMQLYDSDGALVSQSASTITQVASGPGSTYRVDIRAYYSGQTGSYELAYASAPGTSEFGLLENGTMQAHSLVAGDLDSFKFDAGSGDSVILSISGDLSVWMQVYDPTGANIANGSSVITINSLSQVGTYTVIVRSYYANQFGNYDLHYTNAPGANELGELPNSGAYSGTLSPGDLDSFSFDVASGDRLF